MEEKIVMHAYCETDDGTAIQVGPPFVGDGVVQIDVSNRKLDRCMSVVLGRYDAEALRDALNAMLAVRVVA